MYCSTGLWVWETHPGAPLREGFAVRNTWHHGNPCNSCVSCCSFSSSGLDNFELDLSEGDAGERASYVKDRAKADPWGKSRVIIVLNADTAPPRAFDQLLSPLEGTPLPNTFILLARDLRRVRPAIASRCESFGLRPLLPAVAKKLLAVRLPELGTVPDDKALDFLVSGGRGLPKELEKICTRVAGLSELTVASAKRALGFDWTEEAVERCRALLARWPETRSALELRAGVDKKELLRRMHICFCHAYLHGIHPVPASAINTDPALLYDDDALGA